MKKKTHKKKARRRSPSLRLVLYAFSIVSCIAFGIFFYANATRQQTFCANSISCIKDLSGNYEPNQKGVFEGKEVVPPSAIAENITTPPKAVLGTASSADKHINVDLAAQHLYAYQGSTLVYDFPVSTGKWHPTPTGKFFIWIKLRYTRMTGGSGADYYDLPNVPYVMFFYNNDVSKAQGFSLHGAYWHNNFGHPMSHGCVNMRIEDAKLLFAWADPPTDGPTTYATVANPGTDVTIYGQTPLQ